MGLFAFAPSEFWQAAEICVFSADGHQFLSASQPTDQISFTIQISKTGDAEVVGTLQNRNLCLIRQFHQPANGLLRGFRRHNGVLRTHKSPDRRVT